MTTLEKARFLRVLISEEYEGKDGKTKAWHEVGRAWAKRTKDGREYVSVRLVPGISVSGEFVIMPADDKDDSPKDSEPRQHGDGGDKGKRFGGKR